MPSWTNKDERQYEHIKEGYEHRGTPEDRAQEIAARTVNKERREEGRTPNARSQGTGKSAPRLGISLQDRVGEPGPRAPHSWPKQDVEGGAGRGNSRPGVTVE